MKVWVEAGGNRTRYPNLVQALGLARKLHGLLGGKVRVVADDEQQTLLATIGHMTIEDVNG